MGRGVPRKEKVWREPARGVVVGRPVWVGRSWTLGASCPFEGEEAEGVIAAVGLPWQKAGAIITALPADEVMEKNAQRSDQEFRKLRLFTADGGGCPRQMPER